MSAKPPNPRPTDRAIRDPAAVWSLGQCDAFRLAVALVALNLRQPGSLTPEQTREAVDRLKDSLARAAHDHWDTFLSAAGISGPMAMLPPQPVEFDEEAGAPVVSWERDAAGSGGWEHVDLVTQAGRLQLLTPFRQIRINQLPDDALLVPLESAEHVALAAFAEYMVMLHRDVTETIRGVSPRAAWTRCMTLARFYGSAVAMAVRAFRADELTTQGGDTATTAAEALQLIARLGRSPRAHQALTLHLARMLFDEQLTDIARATVAERRPAELVARLKRFKTAAEAELAATNRARIEAWCAKHGRTVPADAQLLVIFRPIPAGAPVLAAVPGDAGAKVVRLARGDTEIAP